MSKYMSMCVWMGCETGGWDGHTYRAMHPMISSHDPCLPSHSPPTVTTTPPNQVSAQTLHLYAVDKRGFQAIRSTDVLKFFDGYFPRFVEWLGAFLPLPA